MESASTQRKFRPSCKVTIIADLMVLEGVEDGAEQCPREMREVFFPGFGLSPTPNIAKRCVLAANRNLHHGS